MSIYPAVHTVVDKVNVEQGEVHPTEDWVAIARARAAERGVFSPEDQALVDEIMTDYAPVWEALANA